MTGESLMPKTVAHPKSVGAMTSLTFLGILVDTELSELLLPQDKLAHVKALVIGLGEGEENVLSINAIPHWTASTCCYCSKA